jgi:hypothetical protein
MACPFVSPRQTHVAAFIVSPDVALSIVGMNIIAPRRLVLDPVTCKIDFREESSAAAVAQMPQDCCGNIADVRVAKRITLKAHHGHLVKLGLFDQDGHRIRRSIETIVDMDLVAHAVKTNSCGSYYALMPNASNKDRVLPRGTLVRKAQDLNEWLPLNAASATEITKPGVPMRPHTSAEQDQIIYRIKESINRTVPYQYRDNYARMLIAREHFFSADTNDIDSTNLLEHQIDLKNNDPINCPEFRLPAEHLKHIQENVAGWLQCGIIERSKSNYNSPIFCVPKKDGQGICTVLDYRMLNSRSLLSLYSVCTINECIEVIGRANSKVFSAADVSNAFWTLSTRASDRPYTAFTIPGTGQFQWCRMAQGLPGSPGYFSRLMDLIMAGAENVLTYIDDLLVHSKNHSEHLVHLANALDRVGKANLRLNLTKCIFGAWEVEYLGHTITSAGIKPGTDKSDAMRSAPIPHTVKEVRSFNGLANYF